MIMNMNSKINNFMFIHEQENEKEYIPPNTQRGNENNQTVTPDFFEEPVFNSFQNFDTGLGLPKSPKKHSSGRNYPISPLKFHPRHSGRAYN